MACCSQEFNYFLLVFKLRMRNLGSCFVLSLTMLARYNGTRRDRIPSWDLETEGHLVPPLKRVISLTCNNKLQYVSIKIGLASYQETSLILHHVDNFLTPLCNDHFLEISNDNRHPLLYHCLHSEIDLVFISYIYDCMASHSNKLITSRKPIQFISWLS